MPCLYIRNRTSVAIIVSRADAGLSGSDLTSALAFGDAAEAPLSSSSSSSSLLNRNGAWKRKIQSRCRQEVGWALRSESTIGVNVLNGISSVFEFRNSTSPAHAGNLELIIGSAVIHGFDNQSLHTHRAPRFRPPSQLSHRNVWKFIFKPQVVGVLWLRALNFDSIKQSIQQALFYNSSHCSPCPSFCVQLFLI